MRLRSARQAQLFLQQALGFAEPALVQLEAAQVAEHAALRTPVADLAGDAQRRLVLLLRGSGVAAVDRHGAQAVGGGARQLAGTGRGGGLLRLRVVVLGRLGPRFVAVPMAQLQQDLRFEPAVAGAAGIVQRGAQALPGFVAAADGVERAAGDQADPRPPGGRMTRQSGHRARQLGADAEGPAPAQHFPGCLERAHRRGRIAVQHRAAAGDHQVVEIGLAVERPGRRAARGEPACMAQLRRARGLRPAAGQAPRRRQVLGGIVLHALQQLEAVVAHALHQRLVDQRLQHVHRPGRRTAGRQIEHRLGGFEREPAREHRQLRQRRAFGGVQQLP